MIKDHQDLLRKFYEADHQCIWERSSNITEDIRKLDEEVKDYAERNNLKVPEKF